MPALPICASRNNEVRLGRKRRLGQPQRSGDQPRKEIVAMLDTKPAMSANGMCGGVRAANRFRELRPGGTQKTRIETARTYPCFLPFISTR